MSILADFLDTTAVANMSKWNLIMILVGMIFVFLVRNN